MSQAQSEAKPLLVDELQAAVQLRGVRRSNRDHVIQGCAEGGARQKLTLLPVRTAHQDRVDMSKPTNLRAWMRTSMSTSASDSECSSAGRRLAMRTEAMLRQFMYAGR